MLKGQTALEYILTYGWAILIILIVAGVLAYYGVFAPEGFLIKGTVAYTLTSQIKCYNNTELCFEQRCVSNGISIRCFNISETTLSDRDLKLIIS
jgi:hypothetical protein